MSKRKTFTSGQAVEIQREPGAPWEPATYDKLVPGMPGHHLANIPASAPPRIITMPVGDKRDIQVRWINIPAQRIRASKVAVIVALPSDVVAALNSYLDTDWSDGRDPSKLGALNAVAHIGERVAAIYASTRKPS